PQGERAAPDGQPRGACECRPAGRPWRSSRGRYVCPEAPEGPVLAGQQSVADPACAAGAAWVPPSTLPGGGSGYAPGVRLTLLPSAGLQQVLLLAASRGLRRTGGRS